MNDHDRRKEGWDLEPEGRSGEERKLQAPPPHGVSPVRLLMQPHVCLGEQCGTGLRGDQLTRNRGAVVAIVQTSSSARSALGPALANATPMLCSRVQVLLATPHPSLHSLLPGLGQTAPLTLASCCWGQSSPTPLSPWASGSPPPAAGLAPHSFSALVCLTGLIPGSPASWGSLPSTGQNVRPPKARTLNAVCLTNSPGVPRPSNVSRPCCLLSPLPMASQSDPFVCTCPWVTTP